MLAFHSTDRTPCVAASDHSSECPRDHRYAPTLPVSWPLPGVTARATITGLNRHGVHLTGADRHPDYWPADKYASTDRLIDGMTVDALT